MGISRRVASPKPLCLGHAQAKETVWHGTRLNRGCGCVRAKTVQVESQDELVREWPKRGPFSIKLRRKQAWFCARLALSLLLRSEDRLRLDEACFASPRPSYHRALLKKTRNSSRWANKIRKPIPENLSFSGWQEILTQIGH